jgi:hypothetical protein
MSGLVQEWLTDISTHSKREDIFTSDITKSEEGNQLSCKENLYVSGKDVLNKGKVKQQ